MTENNQETLKDMAKDVIKWSDRWELKSGRRGYYAHSDNDHAHIESFATSLYKLRKILREIAEECDNNRCSPFANKFLNTINRRLKMTGSMRNEPSGVAKSEIINILTAKPEAILKAIHYTLRQKGEL